MVNKKIDQKIDFISVQSENPNQKEQIVALLTKFKNGIMLDEKENRTLTTIIYTLSNR